MRINGGEASLDAPRNYEQNVNKGADKKTEGFTLCFLLVALALNYQSNQESRLF